MKFNKNLILGLILFILLILAYILQGPMKTWQQNSSRADNFLADIKIAEIAKLEIGGPGQKVVLEKEAKRWKVGGTKDFYVSDELAASISSALNALTREDFDIVSSNQDKKNEFQTDESGIKIIIFVNGEEYDLVLGKRTSNFVGGYISRGGDKRTYAVDVNLHSVFARDEWRDNQIFSFAKEDVASVRFQYPDREFVVAKNDDVWQDVSADKINAILDAMSDMKAAAIPEQDFTNTGLEKNSMIIQVKGKAINETLMIGDQQEDTGYYYAKKGSSDNIYLITAEEKDVLDVSLGDLK